MRVTRRGLLRRGGAGAATAAALAGLPGAARAAGSGKERRRALLVVLPLVRADHVKAFKDGDGADTPNLNDLTGDSLRFDRAVPECMPSLPVRRTLITGMRSYPVPRLEADRGHARGAGLQPRVGLAARHDRGDDRGRREGDLRDGQPDRLGPALPRGAQARGRPRPGGAVRDGIRSEIEAIARATRATERTYRAGIAALGEVKDEDSFFVAVDPFDPVDAVAAPPIYIRPGVVEHDGIGPMSDRLVELKFSDGDTKPLRSAYRDHVEAVDDQLGKLLDAVPDDTLVFVLGDIGYALGDHSFLGRGTPTSYRRAYEIPYLIRHPDGKKGGDSIEWYASTHDVPTTILAHLGPHDPRARCAARTSPRCSTTWTSGTCRTGPSRSPRAAS